MEAAIMHSMQTVPTGWPGRGPALPCTAHPPTAAPVSLRPRHLRCQALHPQQQLQQPYGWQRVQLQQQQQQQQQQEPDSRHQRWQRLAARASKRDKDKGGEEPEDKGGAKADFSAYWSLKFRNFFSGRREYLEKASKRKDPPKALTAVDQLIKQEQKQLDEVERRVREDTIAARAASGRARLARMSPEEKAAAKEALASLPPPGEVVLRDVDAAREAVRRQRAVKLALAVPQLRAALRALVLLPVSLPAEAHRRWAALFASQRYENFLMAEGERIWFWRNRMENERWFWEVFFWERIVVPLAWSIAYQAIVPNNLLWAVLVPLCFIVWNTGSLPHLLSMESLVILVFGVYGKCWGQVTGLANLLLRWA